MSKELATEIAKPLLTVHFTDFWKGFDPENNFFINLLRESFKVEIDSVKPDILFYSYKGNDFLTFDCNRVFFTGENIRPRLFDCDYALCFDYSSNKRIIRLPLYVLYKGFETLVNPKDVDQLVSQKSKFCSFVVSNRYSQKRMSFFKKLSEYKKVDSGGGYLNNIGYPVVDKSEFLKPYKFNIAFENTSFPGYTTEKVMEPMVAGSIPIYWGNPLIDKDFNTKSFINWNDFGSDEAVIERIIELDQDEEKYRKMLTEPWLTDNKFNQFNDIEVIKQKLNSIVVDARHNTPVGSMAMKRLFSSSFNRIILPVNRNLVKLRKKVIGN
jgi:hypothetical protein